MVTPWLIGILGPLISAVIVYLARTIVNAGREIRQNKVATDANTRKLSELNELMNGRFTVIEADIAELKRRR